MNYKISVKLTEMLVSDIFDVNNIRYVKIAYSLECILNEMEKLLLSCLVFYTMNLLSEYLICFLVTCLTRIFLGGIHFKSGILCFLFSITIYLLAIALGYNIEICFPIKILIVLGEIYCMYKYAPIQSKQRPVYKAKQRNRFKMLGILGIQFCLIAICYFPMYMDIILWLMLLQQLEVYLKIILEGGFYGSKKKKFS